MLKARFALLACASVFGSTAVNAQFADSVISYTPGAGVSSGYDNPSNVLGAPTTFIGYQNTDPFNPPYLATDLTSVGAGGSLTVHFSTPILNDPAHPFGLDFNIFGNTGFVITNGDYSGGGVTDGSLFGNNSGVTRVLVSADNVSYYQLDPARARTVDGLFPTDSAGDFTRPVNPGLSSADFAGLDLAGIRSLYAGSGGGTGYAISWAEDGGGHSVYLPSVSYVRVEVVSGRADIDAFAVVPEPTAGLLLAAGGMAGGFLRQRSMRILTGRP